MKTTGINAIDVVVEDLSVVTAEYVRVFGFTDCGVDENGHMTQVGDFLYLFSSGSGQGWVLVCASIAFRVYPSYAPALC